jgi:hypothetical protein
MSNSGTTRVQAHAQPRGRARIRELAKQKGVPNHASAGRVTRAEPIFAWNSADLWPSCLSAEGVARRRVNPVVVTLVRVDWSPIGRAPSRARNATRSVD